MTSRTGSMPRRRWLFVVGGAVLAAAGGAPARAGEPRKPTGRSGGLVVPLGPYTGELLVWETTLDLVLFDAKGALVGPAPFKATARLRKTSGKGGEAEELLTLHPAEDRLRARWDGSDVRAMTVAVELEGEGKTYAGAVEWRRGLDRARINDQRMPPGEGKPRDPEPPRRAPPRVPEKK